MYFFLFDCFYFFKNLKNTTKERNPKPKIKGLFTKNSKTERINFKILPKKVAMDCSHRGTVSEYKVEKNDDKINCVRFHIEEFLYSSLFIVLLIFDDILYNVEDSIFLVV